MSSTQFKKGYDPRRYKPPNSGLTEYRKQFAELLRDRADLAVEYMFEVLQDPKASQRLRVEVAKDICDRFYGKAVDRVAVQQINSSQTLPVDELGTAELNRLIGQITGNVDEKQPIDIDPVTNDK